ncbi:RNA polymerase sigma factor [Mesobacillus foraminis]|uniref:RNA polymerase sigma factor n=1 Tax=Mesobacillus foraminis TaxID=279826 RepID=UPI001BEC04A0|nr:RNA polymerase sigma factor [Mesobacillus foraminis]MBT2756906.1 RNA polymerase sigma factor [Mesobacillus foraminis]
MQREKKELISEWYDEHSHSVLSYTLMMVRDYQQAEDLTHETFVKAFIHFDSFKGNSSVKTWLFSIAHNLTVDFLRKRKPIPILKELLAGKPDEGPLPEDMVLIQENSEALYKALGKIKETHREIIILRKIKGFTIEETAKILNCSESKVKSVLFRALPALEKQLLKEGFFHEGEVRESHY